MADSIFTTVPTTRQVIIDRIEEEIGHFFKRFEERKFPDDSSIAIITIPTSTDVRAEVKSFYENRNYLTKTVGEIEHILYHYKGTSYQIDIHFKFTDNDFNAFDLAEMNDCMKLITFKFIEHCGYKIRNKGLSVQIIDKNGKTKFVEITEDVEVALKLLCLKNMGKEKLDDAEKFAEWILSSERYGSDCFDTKKLSTSGSEEEKDIFTILDMIETQASIFPTSIDLRLINEIDEIDDLICHEINVLGDDAKKIKDFCVVLFNEKKSESLISGNLLVAWGYEPSKIFKTIMEDVSQKFNEDSNIQEIKLYILKEYPLSVHGKQPA